MNGKVKRTAQLVFKNSFFHPYFFKNGGFVDPLEVDKPEMLSLIILNKSYSISFGSGLKYVINKRSRNLEEEERKYPFEMFLIQENWDAFIL